MYQHPLRPQPTWPTAQFAQGPKPPSLSAWPSAPVISTIQNAPASAIPRPVPHQSFVPPAPPGVNPQQWQTGRWMYTGPAAGAASAQPHGPYPPPNLVGWSIPAGWGITPQYYHPAQVQKQPDRSYWETKLTDNGLGLENMHIKKPATHSGSGEGKDKAPHTPWTWVPRELEDDDDSPQASAAPQYPNGGPHSQQPSPSRIQPGGRQNGATGAIGSAGVGGTSYPGPGPHPAHSLPSHAYFSLPPDQQQQQQQHQQQSAADAGSGSRPALPPPAVYSAHVRQQSNPHQTTSATHHQPSTAPGSQPTNGLPSQPTPSAQALLRSQGVAAPTPQRPNQRESFTSVKQLRPTFSPAIVRTPSHYRHDSSQPVVPSPLVTQWDEGSGNSNMAGISTSANKHLSGAQHAVVPSPRVHPWNAHPRVNDGGSPTPAPRSSRMARTESAGRIYESSARTSQPLQRSYSIPEPPRFAAPVSRQHSMPVVPSSPDSLSQHSSSMANLPQFAEEPGSGSVMSLSPLLGAMSSDSSESSASATVVAGSPPPLFIPPRHSRTPSPCPPRHRRSRATSRSSSSSPSSSESSSDSEGSDTGRRQRHRRYHSPSDGRSHRHRTYSGHSGGHHHHHHHHPPNGHHHPNDHYPSGTYPAPGTYTPPRRSPASSTHTHSSSSSNPLPTPPQERRDPGFSLPPPQQPKPPRGSYRRALRYGFWNRRGDYLTMDKYVVYAPRGCTNPADLEGYPAATDGYRDHLGHFVKYDPTLRELPESLPRQGQPPVLPYDKFITYVYL